MTHEGTDYFGSHYSRNPVARVAAGPSPNTQCTPSGTVVTRPADSWRGLRRGDGFRVSMNDFASNCKPVTPGRGRAVDILRQTAPLFLLVCLLVASAASCGVDQGVADRGGPGEDVDTGGETDPLGDANIVSVFPLHDAPLGTDNGGHYWAGRMVLHEGCLRVDVPPDANGPGGASLLIWPSGFAVNSEDSVVSVIDGNGRLSARAGDHIRLSRATISYEEARDQGLIRGASEDCSGPYYMVGDEVSVFDPQNESTELSLVDPDIIFPRERTIIATGRERLAAEGSGELVLDGQCLRLKDGPTIIWPAGFEPHAEQGVVQVRNGAGRVIAQVGDEIVMGGGYGSSNYGGCPGGTFGVHSIKVLPDVEVYLPKEDGTLGNEQEMERYVGKLVLDGKCLVIDHAVRVRDSVIAIEQQLVIWPVTFALDLEDAVPGIVDASGRVVARVGDEVQFGAVSVSYQDAMEHSGLREILPACAGDYLVVKEEFASTGHLNGYPKFPNRDLSNLTHHELDMICELVGRPHFGMSSSTELYFDKRGQLVLDIDTGRKRDTWPYRETLRQKCPGAQ